MNQQPTTTTPDPELVVPLGPGVKVDNRAPAAADAPQAQAAQQPGGGGAPGTGDEDPAAPPARQQPSQKG